MLAASLYRNSPLLVHVRVLLWYCLIEKNQTILCVKISSRFEYITYVVCHKNAICSILLSVACHMQYTLIKLI
jgi:hypothetical protein